jgi:lactoylglutathione lyase
MMENVKYVHTNIVAKDWRRLAQFYVDTFGCRAKAPERDLAGKWLDRLTGLENAGIRGIHLILPGYGEAGPTLEIFQYSESAEGTTPRINGPGFAHIAFSVDDVREMMAMVEKNGGGRVGEPVSAVIQGVGAIDVAYLRDPEGNIIELQKWEES